MQDVKVVQLFKVDDEYRVDTRIVASLLGNEHRSVFRLIRQYEQDFQEFGLVRFEIAKPLPGSMGGRPQRFALLNEDQCYLILTYSDNTPDARKAKKALVRAFADARKQAGLDAMIGLVLLTSPAPWELRFKPGYYQALARVTGTKYLGHAHGTPAIWGQITDRYVYGALLPEEIHRELKARRDKSQKMHQWLTDGGQDVLDRQIALVTSIAMSSSDYADFRVRMMSVSNRGGQLGFVFPKAA